MWEKARFKLCYDCWLRRNINWKNKELLNNEKGKYNHLKYGSWYKKAFDENNEYFVWLFDIEEKIVNENVRRNKELRSDLSGIKINR